tara:strand:- start:1 stop:168 length:168 start_codon:yes stop_codon:yes gene_type:complete
MIYINLKTDELGIETVDEFDTRKEALRMLKEYQSLHVDGYYYISSRSTQYWRERE